MKFLEIFIPIFLQLFVEYIHKYIQPYYEKHGEVEVLISKFSIQDSLTIMLFTEIFHLVLLFMLLTYKTYIEILEVISIFVITSLITKSLLYHNWIINHPISKTVQMLFNEFIADNPRYAIFIELVKQSIELF